MTSPFFWYELMTTDTPAAEAFYKAVVGWNTEAFPGSDMGYTIVKAGDFGVGGIMAQPPHLAEHNVPPAWVGYIHAVDVDATVAKLKAAGGHVHREPWDIPGVGRLAVVSDPQGAVFNLMAAQGEAPAEKPAADAVGLVGWRELLAADLDSVWGFYAGQFGWTKAEAIDMGDMGPYQLFNVGDGQQGGIMTKPPMVPQPYWGFYFNVEDIDDAAGRVTANGGSLMMEPMQVPGGQWVLNAADPQGAVFGLVAPRKG